MRASCQCPRGFGHSSRVSSLLQSCKGCLCMCAGILQSTEHSVSQMLAQGSVPRPGAQQSSRWPVSLLRCGACV